jgi:hypothetical protein
MAKVKKDDAPTGLTARLNPRQQLLQTAMNITSADRNKAYGDPENNFRNIAVYWSQHLSASTGLEIVLSPSDVASMMMLMKLARLSTNPTHYDSILDVAGYAACAADCIAAEQNKNRGAMEAGNSISR